MFKSEQIKKDYKDGYIDKYQAIELLGKELRKLPGFRKGEF